MSDISTMTDEELIHLAPPEDTTEIQEEEDNLVETEDTSTESDAVEEHVDNDDTEEDEEEILSDEDLAGTVPDYSTKEDDNSDQDGDEGATTASNDPDTSAVGSEEVQQFYNRVLAPFKANGKEIAPRNADEVIKLMQMGANFTKKMQEIAPYRKTLVSLEKLDLLDEGKLNYLIDLYNKKPEAIKKLLQDSEYDPMDMDYDDGTSQPDYVPSNHFISDAEVRFDEVLDHVQSMPGGDETLNVVHNTWDKESKKVLWESPELLEAIHTQRQNGIYDQITQEVERMRVLGQIPAHVSFIQAYRTVGDELNAKGAFTANTQQAPRPTAVTTNRTKATVENDKRAKSASITRGNPQKGKNKIVDLTDTSDDAFLEAMSKILR